MRDNWRIAQDVASYIVEALDERKADYNTCSMEVCDDGYGIVTFKVNIFRG
jgi:hypothetical protein